MAASWPTSVKSFTRVVNGVTKLVAALFNSPYDEIEAVETWLDARKDAIVKAWASVTYTGGTPALSDSYNVSGITDTGVGQLTVTWNTDFASVNYAVVASSKQAAAEQSVSVLNTVVVGSVLIYIYNAGGDFTDPANSYCIAMGDQ